MNAYYEVKISAGYTTDRHRNALVPMITFTRFDDPNPELRDWVDATLS